MFESISKPADRWFAILRCSATIRAMGERFGVGPEVKAWDSFAILSLIALGFGAGHFVQRAWRKAYFTGRFIWILPVLFFFLTFATYVPQFNFATAIMYYRPPHFSFEMMFGMIANPLGVTVAHRRHK